MCSLVMSLFSRDSTKIKIDQLKYQQCLVLSKSLLTYTVQYLLSARFLDGRTLILVSNSKE